MVVADISGDPLVLPDVHGDNIATVLPAGTITGPVAVYDPYGNPIATTGLFDTNAIPDTSPGGYDNGWLGQHNAATNTPPDSTTPKWAHESTTHAPDAS